jgi:hypothetical protein
MCLSFSARCFGQRRPQPRAGNVVRFQDFVTQAAPGQKNSHQQMIRTDADPAAVFSPRQAHRQAHGALRFRISSQSARHRTLGPRRALVNRFANSPSLDRQ